MTTTSQIHSNVYTKEHPSTVGKCIQLTATFFGGFIVAFAKGWLLTVVMLSSIPPVVIAGAAMSLTMSKLSSRGQQAYAEAGTEVEQSVGSIRTVVSFTGERKAIENYTKLVKCAYRSAVREGAVAGLGVGCVLLIVFSSYGLPIWYGSKLIVSRGYNGGEVFNHDRWQISMLATPVELCGKTSRVI